MKNSKKSLSEKKGGHGGVVVVVGVGFGVVVGVGVGGGGGVGVGVGGGGGGGVVVNVPRRNECPTAERPNRRRLRPEESDLVPVRMRDRDFAADDLGAEPEAVARTSC